MSRFKLQILKLTQNKQAHMGTDYYQTHYCNVERQYIHLEAQHVDFLIERRKHRNRIASFQWLLVLIFCL